MNLSPEIEKRILFVWLKQQWWFEKSHIIKIEKRPSHFHLFLYFFFHKMSLYVHNPVKSFRESLLRMKGKTIQYRNKGLSRKKNTWEHREHWCIDSLLTDFRTFSSGVEIDEEGKECVEGRFVVEVNFSFLMGKANFTMGGWTNGIFFSSFPKGTARLQLLHHTTTWHVLTS